MNEKTKEEMLQTIIEKEKLRPLSRIERLFKDPLGAVPYYILAASGHIKPFKVRFKTMWGDWIEGYLPETNTFYYYGFCEANVTSFLIRFLKPGDVFIDVGANIGFYTLLASRLVDNAGQVHSFEPTPSTFSILKSNIDHLRNVRLNNLGVSDKESEISFKDFGLGYTAYNTASREKVMLEKAFQKIKIQTIDLDTYCQENNTVPTFIKLDAEGFEYKILEGMRNILNSIKPLITLEMANDANWSENYHRSSSLLLDNNYKPYEIRDDGFIEPCEIKNNYTYTNILFVPQERTNLIQHLIK